MGGSYIPIDAGEVDALARTYGTPVLRTIDIVGDEDLFASRLYRSVDRRAEVVLAVERPDQRMLLHRKGWYDMAVYRLLSGGINLTEPVAEAMIRELREETSLVPLTARFLGVLDCRLHFNGHALPFASYVFHIQRTEGQLQLPQTEDICEFREVPIASLAAVAEHLRGVPAPRSGWGRWRAVAHDFVHEMLSPAAAAGDAPDRAGQSLTVARL